MTHPQCRHYTTLVPDTFFVNITHIYFVTEKHQLNTYTFQCHNFSYQYYTSSMSDTIRAITTCINKIPIASLPGPHTDDLNLVVT